MIFGRIFFIFFISGVYAYQGLTDDICPGDPKIETQASQRSECYFNHNQPEKAIVFLKQALSYHDSSKTLHLLLAKAYILDKNNLWALKTLYGYDKNISGDPEILSWIVWCHIRQGQLEKAEEILKKNDPGRNVALAARNKLLSSMLSVYQNKPEQAWNLWKEAKSGLEVFTEDKALYKYVLIWTDPRGNGPISISADGITGYSSNPSITSSFKEEDAEGSPMFGENVSLHFEPPLFYRVKPFLTVSQKIFYYSKETASPYSYFIPDFISGIRFKTNKLELMPSYHGGAFLLNSPYRFAPEETWLSKKIKPRESSWFYEFHRFEMGINYKNNYSLIAGAGKRFFNHHVRSRWETDVTGLGQIFHSGNFRLTGAFSLRMYKANQMKYDLLGGTILFSMRHGFIKEKLYLSSGFLFSKDLYSNYLWGRDDILINVLPGIWYRYNNMVKIGLTYEYAKRYSSIKDYIYEDNRINLKFNTSLRFYPFFTKTAGLSNHVSLPYNLHAGSEIEQDDSIKELLEQREDIQRGSSCLE